MGKFKIKRQKEHKLIWSKTRHYIDFIILACCLVITFNIHPNNSLNNLSNTDDIKSKMIYIFHDYEWNEYILNDTIHGAADSWDYLFDDEIPTTLKWEDTPTNSVSLANLSWEWSNQWWAESTWASNIDTESNLQKNESDSIKDNQISLDDIMNNLWMNDRDITYEHNNANNQSDNTDALIIDISETNTTNSDDTKYTIKEETNEDNSTLIIEKQPNKEDKENNKSNLGNEDELSAKTFTYTFEWWVIPTLIPRDQLSLYRSSISWSTHNNDWSTKNTSWVTIVDDYSSCMTPRWYKIPHWDSVLAYQQMDNAPDICNIERRFCWKWKLSWTYTQQWCSINPNYTYEQRWEADVPTKEKESRYKTSQNDDWTVSVSDEPWTWSFALDRPGQRPTTDYHLTDNVSPEDIEVDQTERVHRNCTAPWGEKVKHWMFVQAFKHSNGFSDAPCEAQLRLCTNWELMWTYTESTCKTWDTSFIDWINWSPTRETYSKEKLDRVKDLINEEVNYDKWLRRFSNSDELETILTILDD